MNIGKYLVKWKRKVLRKEMIKEFIIVEVVWRKRKKLECLGLYCW